MKHYIVKWPCGDICVVGARNELELFDLLDALGPAHDTKVLKLPTVPFCLDIEKGSGEIKFDDESGREAVFVDCEKLLK